MSRCSFGLAVVPPLRDALDRDGFCCSPRTASGFSETLGATAPVHYLGLVDLVTRVVVRGQTRRGADCAVDIDHPAASAAGQVVVVVTGPTLEARRRPGGLDAPNETLLGKDAEGVVHRLTGDDADLGPYGLGDVVRSAVRLTRYRRQNRQALGRDLNAVLAEEIGWIVTHNWRIRPISDSVKNLATVQFWSM
jgi:hypothetical protein